MGVKGLYIKGFFLNDSSIQKGSPSILLNFKKQNIARVQWKYIKEIWPKNVLSRTEDIYGTEGHPLNVQ